MSSRWMASSASDPGWARFASAWAAFTSEDLPMPRAPQSIAVAAPAGRARSAKVFFQHQPPLALDALQQRHADGGDAGTTSARNGRGCARRRHLRPWRSG